MVSNTPDHDISSQLSEIFHYLIECYGKHDWWPADSPFEVVVGAILTQMTTWKNVEKAMANLKSCDLLSPGALFRIEISELANLIYPSGFYNSKAIKLKSFVTRLHEHYNEDLGNMFSLPVSTLRKELLSIRGIGPETADSIILYAAEKPVFVIDAYSRRIVSRMGLYAAECSYDSIQAFFVNYLPTDVKIFGEYHALLVQHGKNKCRMHPHCSGCCLQAICQMGISIEQGQVLVQQRS